MAETIQVGQTDTLSLAWLDENGQPMATVPTPDAVPTWTNTNTAAETLEVAADGMTAVQKAAETGADGITFDVTVGGKTFSASIAVTVEPKPQVLTTVQIVSGTPA